MKSCLLLLICILLSAAQSAFAAGWIHKDDLKGLLSSRSRPTMLELVKVVGISPANNPFDESLEYWTKDSFEDAQNDITRVPRTIAFMEYVFPGATWAPLGRDAVLFGDLLDAFYLTLGEKGRVVRLNGSGDSIREVGERRLLRFMESAGVDLRTIAQGRPFVGLDRTGFGVDSQSKMLLRAVYNAYEKNQGDPKNLISQLNFLGLTAPGGFRSITKTVADHYFEEVALDENRTVDHIIQLPASDWADSLPWHDSFSALRLGSNGKYEGAVGRLSVLEDRERVLAQMIWILQNVSDPAFSRQVSQSAKKFYGYKFKVSPRAVEVLRELKRENQLVVKAQARQETISKSKKLKARVENYPATLAQSFKDLLNKRALSHSRLRILGKLYLSPRANILSDWITDERDALASLTKELEKMPDGKQLAQKLDESLIPIQYLSEITSLRRRAQISQKDYLLMLAKAMNEIDTNSRFFRRFESLFESNRLLQKTLVENASYFLDFSADQILGNSNNSSSNYYKVRKWILKHYDVQFPPCEEAFYEAFL